jgi:hypothetical protein
VGGVLAEETGLGKTLKGTVLNAMSKRLRTQKTFFTVLGLILANPAPPEDVFESLGWFGT